MIFTTARLTWYEDQLTTLAKKENLEYHVNRHSTNVWNCSPADSS